MAIIPIKELIERVNTLNPYVGVIRTEGRDPKGRICLGRLNNATFMGRKKSFGLTERITYVNSGNEEDRKILSIWDYLPPEVNPIEIYRLPMDPQGRILVASSIPLVRAPLIICGRGNHMDVYYESEWTKIQAESSRNKNSS